MIVVTQAGAQVLLEKGLDGLTATVDVHLYQNDYAPDPGTVLADFTEADYSGYTEETITPASWPIFFQGISQVVAVGPGIVFTPNASTIANVIYGYYVTDSTGTRLLWAERFAEQKVMNGVTTGFTLVPAIGGQSAAG
jgi:hypothetical protein